MRARPMLPRPDARRCARTTMKRRHRRRELHRRVCVTDARTGGRRLSHASAEATPRRARGVRCKLRLVADATDVPRRRAPATPARTATEPAMTATTLLHARWKPPSSAAAASGASTRCSTSSPACTRSSRATPAAANAESDATTTSAAAAPATPRSCASRSTPSVLSFRDLLTVFFTIHDPTTQDRQGNDVGTQYRSVIFCQSPEQRATARGGDRRAHGGEAVEGPDRHRDRRRGAVLRGRALPPGILRAQSRASPIARSSSRPRSRSSASTSPSG